MSLVPSITAPTYTGVSTDTRTLAGEWLARIANPNPGYRNELTVRRIADAIGSKRFEDLFVLSLTNPDLTEAQLSALAGSGPVLEGDPSSPAVAVAMHDMLETSAIAQSLKDMHPDPERCRRALREIEEIVRIVPEAGDRGAAGLCLFAAWVGRDEEQIKRYTPYCLDATRVGVVSVLVGAGQQFGWYPGMPPEKPKTEEPEPAAAAFRPTVEHAVTSEDRSGRMPDKRDMPNIQAPTLNRGAAAWRA